MAEASEVFIARQPIFDRAQRVVGYEILFRDAGPDEAHVVDRAEATSTVVLNMLTEIGLERLVGSQTAWINLPPESLAGDLLSILPPQFTGFEIQAGELVGTQFVEALRELKEQGYRIALDGFRYAPEFEELLALADVVKLDFAELGEQGFAQQVEALKGHNVALAAEKVESHEVHQLCMQFGCEFFQGFFYQEPELMSERRIGVNRAAVLQLMAALQNPALEFADIEPLIARDLPLSLRLLRYINSAFFGLPHEVASVQQALVLLGLANVRRWATLTVMGSLEGKPSELTNMALIRARFCELAGTALGLNGAEMFTVGLFSLIDAMMDTSLAEVLDEMPFPAPMREALLTHKGPMGEVLDCVNALEAGYFGDAKLLIPTAGDLYVEALLWSNDASGALSESAAA